MNGNFSRRVIARTIAAKVLAEPSRLGHWMKVLAAYLLEHKQADLAELIANDIAREIFVQNGELLVDVTSSHELAENVRKDLKKALASSTGAKSVVLNEQTDPSLIGGLVAHTPDAILDISVRSQLKQLAAIN